MKNSKHKEKLAQRLKRLRNCNEFTQQQIAEVLNIDRSTYAYYELGKTEPNGETTIKLAKLFNVSVSELLTGEDDPPTSLEDSSGQIFYYDLLNNLTAKEKKLIMNYRLLTAEEQQKLLELTAEKTAKGSETENSGE